MSIKATVTEAKKPDEFPKLMISDSGEIFLFIRSGEGTVVGGPHVGPHWKNCDMGFFKNFDGSVTLQNE